VAELDELLTDLDARKDDTRSVVNNTEGKIVFEGIDIQTPGGGETLATKINVRLSLVVRAAYLVCSMMRRIPRAHISHQLSTNHAFHHPNHAFCFTPH
jgi:hypothetical protein